MRVSVGECRCDGAHPEDWVELHDEMPFDLGVAAHQALRQYGTDVQALEVALTRTYLRWGIESWSFSENGKEIPIEPFHPLWQTTLERWLPFDKGGFEVTQAANQLYAGRWFDPLVKSPSTPSPDGPTDESTSRTRKSGDGLQTLYERFSRPASAGGNPSGVPVA